MVVSVLNFAVAKLGYVSNKNIEPGQEMVMRGFGYLVIRNSENYD
jgi:hypothetical protein